MSNKRRVYVILFHRDAFSVGENRRRLGFAAYHWGILISPKRSTLEDSHAFDVTNAMDVDRATKLDRNPDMDWRFRAKLNVEPLFSARLLVRIMVGKLPNEIALAQVQDLLGSLPLPRKSVEPEENCVTWEMSAIRAMQDVGWVERFELDDFMTWAVDCADKRIRGPGESIVNYTNRKM